VIDLDYLLPPLVAAGLGIALLVIVLLRGRQQGVVFRIFSLLLVSVIGWALIIFAMRASPDVEHALRWDRAVVPVGFAVSLFYYHFSLAVTGVKQQRVLLRAGYLLLLVVVALSPSSLFIQRMEVQYYGYAPIIGLSLIFAFAFNYFLSIMALYNLIKGYRNVRIPEEKNRLLYITIGMAITLIAGVFEIFPIIYPTAIFGSIVFCVLASVAILKYHLLDIHIIIRKGTVYILLSATIAIPYVGIIFLFTHVFKTQVIPSWVYLVVIIILAMALQPLWSRVQRLVDRWFYRERYDYLKALEQYSQETQSVENLAELGSTIVELVRGALRASSACLLLPSEGKHGLVVASCSGLESPPSGVVVSGRGPLLKWLELHGDTLTSDQLDIIPQLQSLSHIEKDNLEQMGANLCVPIKSRQGHLSGILVLGQKLSQQSYSGEDKQLLAVVTNQLVVALENARLYDKSQQEVAERKQAEEALKESERHYRLLAENAKDAIWTVDMNMRPTYMSPSITYLLGYTVEEAMANPMEAVYTPASFEIAMKILAEELAIENMEQKDLSRSRTMELELNRKDGSIVSVEGNFSFLRGPDGRPVGILAISRDITERKQPEERDKQLQQERILTSRLASIGEMAAGIAHEINNPLTGVIGYADLLLKKNIPENIRKDANIIYDAAQRVAGITSRMLTFASKAKPERASLDVNDIIETTLAMRDYEMKTGNIKATTQLDPGLPTTVADSGQLQQVFLNIILNAEIEMVKAHNSGNLLIKTERINDTIWVSFKDDGPGIAKENVERIFEPFFTTREVGQGAGLGLSVCYGIVTQHGGKIHVESKLGKGATFIVELPIVTEAEQLELAESAPSEPKKVSGARILVVDDEPIILELLTEVLSKEGHEVETMDSGNDALERLRSEDYDVILLDIKLPGMSGIEIYKQLQKRATSLARRVVFITGDVMSRDTTVFLSGTSAPYIAKPFDTEQLKKKIDRILTEGT